MPCYVSQSGGNFFVRIAHVGLDLSEIDVDFANRHTHLVIFLFHEMIELT